MTTTAYDDQFAPQVSGQGVMQEDREAAAAYYYSAGGNSQIARLIREGHRDNWFRVQAFARHREQAARPSADVAELVEAAAYYIDRLEAVQRREVVRDLAEAEGALRAALSKHRTTPGESA